MLKLFSDTDCDITPEIARKYDMGLISMPYSIDGEIVFPYEDFDEFDYKSYYDKLREGVLPNTSAIGEESYVKYFEPVFARGDDILYVHFSAAMTVSFVAMDKAVSKLLEKYPERKFYSIDAKGISVMGYTIACEAGDMLKAGKSAEEIVEWAKTEVDKYAMYFFADDLKFFRHSGRVSGLAATMGTLLGVRPIIYMSPEGQMVSIGKEKGRTKAVNRLISYIEELGDDIQNHRIVIGHTDALEFVDDLTELLKEKFGDGLNIEVMPVNPTIGGHCGPNCVGICFHAIHR